MNLEELLKQLSEKNEKRNGLIAEIADAKTNEELNRIDLELRKMDIEIYDLNNKVKICESNAVSVESRSVNENIAVGGFNPVATYRTTVVGKSDDSEDIYAGLEYRNSFKDYILKGTPIPEKFTQKRADALTTVNDIGAVIPTTIQNKVIEDISIEGKILARITQTAFKGGIEIPISDINITATWLESENVVSDEQKAEMNTRLKFTYHVLESKIAIGLLSDTIALPIFESTIIQQLKKSMTNAIETAIVKGTGIGQPLGFTKYSLPSSQVIKMSSDNISTVAAWAEVESIIPESEEDNVIYIMAKPTWEKYLNGMTDSTGQRIGLGKLNEKGQKILNGREVLTVDKLPSFDSASDGDIFGVVINLSQYCLNSNLSMYYKKYFNEDKNKWIHKSLMIVDGKMAIGEVNGKLIGAKGLIYLKKSIT